MVNGSPHDVFTVLGFSFQITTVLASGKKICFGRFSAGITTSVATGAKGGKPGAEVPLRWEIEPSRGRIVAVARTTRGWEQKDLASALGVAPGTVSNWEREKQKIGASNWKKLQGVFGGEIELAELHLQEAREVQERAVAGDLESLEIDEAVALMLATAKRCARCVIDLSVFFGRIVRLLVKTRRQPPGSPPG